MRSRSFWILVLFKSIYFLEYWCWNLVRLLKLADVAKNHHGLNGAHAQKLVLKEMNIDKENVTWKIGNRTQLRDGIWKENITSLENTAVHLPPVLIVYILLTEIGLAMFFLVVSRCWKIKTKTVLYRSCVERVEWR